MSDDRMPDAGDSTNAEYRALLRELSGAAPLGAADLDALHRRIDAAAELPLARLRRSATAGAPASVPLPDEQLPRPEVAWWEYAARRGRSALWLSVAASLLLAAYVRAHPVETAEVETATMATRVDVRDAFASAVTAGVPSSGVTSLLVASSSDVAMATTDGSTP